MSSSRGARHISNRRINSENQPLLAAHSKSRLSSPPINHDSTDTFSSDEESIILLSNWSKNGNRESSSSSVAENISRYIPGSGQKTLGLRDLLPYYLPIFSWIGEYCPEYFLGDLVGGLSLATFQIPLAISYSTSLAKVPITCGLFSLGIAPLVYMVLGSVPQMITGPEAPMSLIVGQTVEPLLHHSKKHHLSAADYVVSITFVSGATLLGFGLGRFGFLDNVLNESLLKGFICGVGAVMIINSSIPLLGMEKLLEQTIKDPNGEDIHSPFDKVCFLIRHFSAYHALTLTVSICALVSILLMRAVKSNCMKSNKKILQNAVYFPEILCVVVSSTIMCSTFDWDEKGLELVGIDQSNLTEIPFFNPFSMKHLKLMKKLYTLGFVCAMLGFFESTTAMKALGSRYDLPISSNRELVALGTINIFCSMLGGLPLFGGYGRSKINAISARTTCSGAIMGLMSLLTARWVLGYLHYIPRCILSVITTVIGILLMGEGPKEVLFHVKSRGYNELITFFITVITTFFFSIEAGIAVGLVYSLIRVIKSSTLSNIQILGRVPGTNTFVDADTTDGSQVVEIEDGSQLSDTKNRSRLNLFTDNLRFLNFQALEEIQGCLIIKIPEPLNFTNASDLRTRLKRLEMYGSLHTHPALKRTRGVSMSRYMIFDLEGMSSIDSSAAQILRDSLNSFRARGIKCFFVRVQRNEHLRSRLKHTGIHDYLLSDLQAINHFDAYDRAGERQTAPPSQGGKLSLIMPKGAAHKKHEDSSLPYFFHIRDALRVIDVYESNLNSSDDTA